MVLLLAGLVSVCGCSDDDDDGQPGQQVIYSGITKTDETGAVLVEDPEDWLPCDFGTDGEELPPILTGPIPAFPNPSLGRCILGFTMASSGHVRLSVWQSGRAATGLMDARSTESQVLLLVDGLMEAGHHHVVFSGTDGQGNRLAPGLYRCRFETDDCVSTGDISIIAYPFDSERLITMMGFADAHWSIERLDAAYDPNYLDRPGANFDYAMVVGLGSIYFDIVGFSNPPLWVSQVDDQTIYYKNIAMWSQFVFGWDDFVDPRIFLQIDDIDIVNLRDPRTSANREIFRGNQ